MAFPEDPLGARTEMQIGGVWTDVTPYAMTRDVITHTRGRTGEGQEVDPASCSLTLKSPDGLFSPRNPRSPYFGKIGRNTPMRLSVQAGQQRLVLPDDAPTARASTPTAPALNLTGSLDARIELALLNWQAGSEVKLVGKYAPVGNQRSWQLSLTASGGLALRASLDGGVANSFVSTVPVSVPPSGRLALRVTRDSVTGTVTYYTAPSITGTWTQLGAPVSTPAGAIYASTAPLTVGDIEGLDRTLPVGSVYALQVRNGIGGPLVASVDFTAQTSGATSFVDATGLAWTLSGGAAITNRRMRFVGEYSDWPAKWSAGGHLITVSGEGAGILRRLNQGKKALASTLRRRIPSGRPLAYWPMEDGELSTQASSATVGGQPLKVTGLTFGSDDHPSGSGTLPVLGPIATLDGRVTGAQSGGWHVEMVYKLPALPVVEQTMLTVTLAPGAGGVTQAVCRISTAGIKVQVLDSDGTSIAFFTVTTPAGIAAFAGRWNRLQIFSATTGSQTYVTVGWLDVVANTWWYSRTVYTGSPGRVTGVKGSWGSNFEGMSIGHLGVFDVGGTPPPAAVSAGVTVYASADDGFAGETAATRLLRLAVEENLPVTVTGTHSETARMGPQRPATLLEVMEQCAAADGGILVEDRERLGLRYRARTSLYNQQPVLTIPYTSRALGALEPVEDDSGVRNDVTVERDGGSSARAELTAGALSTQDPPAGIGRYDDSITLNLYSDEQTEPMAWWLLYLGTWDEARYPTITLKLHRMPSLIPAILDLAEGDLIRITDLPEFLPPGPIDLLVQGYTERIGVRTWEIDLVCAPAGPWRVGAVGDTAYGIVDTDGSQLAAAVDEVATQLQVAVTAGPVWRFETPFLIRVGGEVMTVTGITGSSPQTFTVVRSVNGIVKSQAAGTDLRLAYPTRVAL
ncbi:hypothetical protein [Streptomyces sp. NPDC006193]|uniref:hypothetical protein n=1 Tax=Streptomyces sp. NPDC006193 TaxID=3155717 RepID=UPI0033B405B1